MSDNSEKARFIEGASIPALQKMQVKDIPTPQPLTGQPVPKIQQIKPNQANQQNQQNQQQQQKDKQA